MKTERTPRVEPVSRLLRGHCKSGATLGETIGTEPELPPCPPNSASHQLQVLGMLLMHSESVSSSVERGKFYFLHRVLMKIRQHVWCLHIIRVNACFKAQPCSSPNLWLPSKIDGLYQWQLLHLQVTRGGAP